MTDFKVDDLVVIIADPKSTDINSHIRMQGMSGYIEEIDGEYAQFHELREDGLGGCGGVLLSNLRLANDNVRLQQLKKAKDERFNKLLEEGRARTKRYNDLRDAAIAEACDLTGVSMRSVIKIFEICEEFDSKWENERC